MGVPAQKIADEIHLEHVGVVGARVRPEDTITLADGSVHIILLGSFKHLGTRDSGTGSGAGNMDMIVGRQDRDGYNGWHKSASNS